MYLLIDLFDLKYKLELADCSAYNQLRPSLKYIFYIWSNIFL